MTVTPNEIMTMQPAVESTHGRVITFGLGLGYYAYMVSEREHVRNVTIIEKNETVIELFEKFILPQFPHREKIDIIACDAFQYTENRIAEGNFDCAFVDLWHDVSDGVDIYKRMKKLECRSPRTNWFYWIEESLLSGLRWYVYEALLDCMGGSESDHPSASGDDGKLFPQEYMDRLNAAKAALEGKDIRTYDDIEFFLSDEFLRQM